ncbi:MAG: hypothetical protein WD578_13590 [Bacteroidales bacterium]
MNKKYLYQISAFLLGTILMVGCVEWDEFESLDLDAAPTVTVVQSAVGDSLIAVDVTSSANGFVSVIILEGTGNVVPSDSVALLKGNVSYLDFASVEVEADVAVTVTFASGIEQDASYEVMAVSANADGVVSEVAVLAITTADTYAPAFVSASPDFTYDPIIEPGDTIVISFDEPVILGSGAFSFEGFYSGDVFEVTNATVSGNNVYLPVPVDFAYREYIWLHWETGAVVDAEGNETSALTTFLDGGAFSGAFWRIVAMKHPVLSVTPDVEVDQIAGFTITLTFGDNVSIANLEDGDITIVYDDEGGLVTTADVPAADVLAAGMEVTIDQSSFVPTTGTVTLVVPEGVIGVGIGNPNAEYSATWNIATL